MYYINESGGLNFTWEMPVNNSIQFLDLKLGFTKDHVCLMCNPRTKKRLLLFDSAHSKLIKMGITTTWLNSALPKSFEHNLDTGFDNQISRSEAARFPPSVITSVCESLLQKIKHGKKLKERRIKMKTLPILYIHKHVSIFRCLSSSTVSLEIYKYPTFDFIAGLFQLCVVY